MGHPRQRIIRPTGPISSDGSPSTLNPRVLNECVTAKKYPYIDIIRDRSQSNAKSSQLNTNPQYR
ncbi:hypothetical protein YC2023_019915 [Brassica napus]